MPVFSLFTSTPQRQVEVCLTQTREMALRFPTAGEVFRAFLIGGVLGAVLDGGHTHTNVLGYNAKDVIVAKMAWWVPPQFGVGGILLLFLPFVFGPRPQRLCKDLVPLGQCIAGVVVYAMSSVLASKGWNDVWISAALALLVLTTWLVTDRSLHTVGLCIFAGVLGWTYEGTLCHLGFFHYNKPDFWLVRHWIAWIWAAAAMGGHGAASALLYDDRKKKQ